MNTLPSFGLRLTPVIRGATVSITRFGNLTGNELEWPAASAALAVTV